MELLKCNDSNNNTEFLTDLIKGMKSDNNNYYWVIADLDLIPLFHGDYNGKGGAKFEEVAYNFSKKVENEKIAILRYNELLKILNDTQTIRNAVLVCFANNFSINWDSFRPTVESKTPNKLSHEDAEYEIRILDGDLFYILKK